MDKITSLIEVISNMSKFKDYNILDDYIKSISVNFILTGESKVKNYKVEIQNCNINIKNGIAFPILEGNAKLTISSFLKSKIINFNFYLNVKEKIFTHNINEKIEEDKVLANIVNIYMNFIKQKALEYLKTKR